MVVAVVVVVVVAVVVVVVVAVVVAAVVVMKFPLSIRCRRRFNQPRQCLGSFSGGL